MDAVQYLKEKDRMTNGCKTSENGCDDCPLSAANNGTSRVCGILERDLPEKAVEIVERWAKEHPPKTRTTDFFKKHPNAPKDSSGVPFCCAKDCGYTNFCNSKIKCADCWNIPIAE